jgi:hypothetical protein
MNNRKEPLDITHLPGKQLTPKLETELLLHDIEICLACKIMKNLRIKSFNSIPTNCCAQQQTDFWCSLIHLDKVLKRLSEF